jgi:hypothetical protein
MQESRLVETPWSDEIVAEVRRVREQLLADCDNDLLKLVALANRSQSQRGVNSVSYPRKVPKK